MSIKTCKTGNFLGWISECLAWFGWGGGGPCVAPEDVEGLSNSNGKNELSPAVLALFPWPWPSWNLWTGPVDPSLHLLCFGGSSQLKQQVPPHPRSASYPQGRLSKTPSQSPHLGQLPEPCPGKADTLPSPWEWHLVLEQRLIPRGLCSLGWAAGDMPLPQLSLPRSPLTCSPSLPLWCSLLMSKAAG